MIGQQGGARGQRIDMDTTFYTPLNALFFVALC